MSADLAYEFAELKRRLDNQIQLGAVETVDAGAARASVRIGDRLTAPLPWLTRRAGEDRDWWAPSPGEQVLVVSPGGDPEQAVAIPALYQDVAPAPGADPSRRVIEMDPSHVWELRCGAVVFELDASGVRILGDVQVTGRIDVSEEVTADGVALSTHKHGGVRSGGALTDEPVAAGGLP